MLPKRILVFGSSSVYGTADSEQGGFVDRLRVWHDAQGERNRVYNLGIWGEDTNSLIARIESEAKARRANLIIIYPGFNDIRRVGSRNAANASSIAEFGELIRTLVTKSQTVAETLLLTGYPFDQERTSPYSSTDLYYLTADAEIYTNCLKDVCADNKVPLLDLSTLDIFEHLAEDGLHCGPSGHQLIFETLQQYLVNNFNE